MFKEYGKYLNKFMEEKKAIDNRIVQFKESIELKENQLEELKENFTSEFIEGKAPDDKRLKQLKTDIEADKEQLELIQKAYKTNKTLNDLGNKAMVEYRELIAKENEYLHRDSQALKKLEKDFEQAKKDIVQASSTRKSILSYEYTKPRIEIAEYVNYPIGEIRAMKMKAQLPI